MLHASVVQLLTAADCCWLLLLLLTTSHAVRATQSYKYCHKWDMWRGQGTDNRWWRLVRSGRCAAPDLGTLIVQACALGHTRHMAYDVPRCVGLVV